MPKTQTQVPEKKLTIRIPTDLHEQIIQLSKDDSRSLNAEILVLLREAVRSRVGN